MVDPQSCVCLKCSRPLPEYRTEAAQRLRKAQRDCKHEKALLHAGDNRGNNRRKDSSGSSAKGRPLKSKALPFAQGPAQLLCMLGVPVILTGV